eukprot:4995237-Amphidinium_carterae.1
MKLFAGASLMGMLLQEIFQEHTPLTTQAIGVICPNLDLPADLTFFADDAHVVVVCLFCATAFVPIVKNAASLTFIP